MRMNTQAKLVPTIIANYVLWPAAHFVNFRFVPTEHRILYNNCVSVRSAISDLSHFTDRRVSLLLWTAPVRQPAAEFLVLNFLFALIAAICHGPRRMNRL